MDSVSGLVAQSAGHRRTTSAFRFPRRCSKPLSLGHESTSPSHERVPALLAAVSGQITGERDFSFGLAYVEDSTGQGSGTLGKPWERECAAKPVSP